MSWQIALPPSQRRTLAPGSAAAKAETAKARVRARVEHPFRIVKRVFGCDMVRYRGAAFGVLEPDDCPAAPVMTGEKRVRNLPDRPRGG